MEKSKTIKEYKMDQFVSMRKVIQPEFAMETEEAVNDQFVKLLKPTFQAICEKQRAEIESAKRNEAPNYVSW